jgi:putative ABC transport system permease protein
MFSRQLIRDTTDTVMDSLRSHKLRAALTLTGVIIGAAVVTTVGAVLSGLSERVANVSEQSAPNVIYFTKQEKIGPSFQTPTEEERQRKELTYEDARAVAALPSVQEVSPQKIKGSYGPAANPPKLTRRERSAINPLILGVWENMPDIVSVSVAQGRFFTAAERGARSQVAVIGHGVARQVFEEEEPVGADIKIDGRIFRVIGVLAAATGEGVIGSDDIDERTVYIPFETADKLFPEVEEVAIVVRAPRGRVDETIDDVSALLRQRRGVALNAPNNFGVNRAEQVFDLVNQIIAALGFVVAPIALASLLVGGVGVMNIMLVSVKERAPEIGIRRALGARRRDVLAQFLFEASLLTGAGGVIGIILGFLFAFLVRFIVKFPAAVPWWAVVAGLGASVLVGLTAGMWPAFRASRLDPVAAMRGD